MRRPKTLWAGLLSGLIVLAVDCNFSFAASIEEVVTSLKGLSPKERLARVANEARREGSVRWASSTPQGWAEPALQIFRNRYPTIKVRVVLRWYRDSIMGPSQEWMNDRAFAEALVAQWAKATAAQAFWR